MTHPRWRAAIVGTIAAIACAAQTTSSENQDFEFHSPFPAPLAGTAAEFRDKDLLGDWLGVRSKLAERGIRIATLLIDDPFGNVTGGRRRGATDYGLVGFGIVVRTDDLLGWHGGQLHVGFADNFGTSLSNNYVGNTFPIQLADVADTHPRLTYLSYTQSLLEDTISVRVGRLTINSVADEEFLGSQYFKAFSSVGVDLVPLGIFLNGPGAFGYPDTTWGARIKFSPNERFYTMVGAYDGDPLLKGGSRHGVDFSMRGPLFLIGEAGLRRGHKDDSTGRDGNLKFGAYYDGGSTNVFATKPEQPPQVSHDRYGLYVLGDQVLLRFGDPGGQRHLGVFGAFTAAPDQRVNEVPYFFNAGLVMYGPSHKRPKDFAGLAVVYGSYSRDLRLAEEIQPTPAGIQHFETTLELNYGWTVRPGLLW